MKRGTVDHPKTCALAAALGVRRYVAVGILESLWHFTAQYAPRGDIGRWKDEAICHAIDWQDDPGVLLQALVATGWLEPHPLPHRYLIHDWGEHLTAGVRMYLRHHGVNPVVSRGAHTRYEPGLIRRGARGNGSSPDPEETEDPTRSGFEAFWRAYPRRIGKREALAAWLRLKPPLTAVLAALAWQCKDPRWLEENQRYVPYPATYLNQRRWEDEAPAPREWTSDPFAAGHPERRKE